jgi:WD40 repeat protein
MGNGMQRGVMTVPGGFNALKFSDRKMVSANKKDGTLTIRSLEENNDIETSIRDHAVDVTCIDFDDTRIVTSQNDGTITDWSIYLRKPFATIPNSTTVEQVIISGNYLVLLCNSTDFAYVKIFYRDTMRTLVSKIVLANTELDEVIKMSVHGEFLLIPLSDYGFKIYNMHTETLIRDIECVDIIAAAFNESIICTVLRGGEDKSVKVWSMETGNLLKTFPYVENGSVCHMSLRGHFLACYSTLSYNINVWDLGKDMLVKTPPPSREELEYYLRNPKNGTLKQITYFLEKSIYLKYNRVSPKVKGMSSNSVCAICIEEFKIDDNVVKLNCNHLFHKACYDRAAKSNSNCPTCRGDPMTIHHMSVRDQMIEDIMKEFEDMINLRREDFLEWYRKEGDPRCSEIYNYCLDHIEDIVIQEIPNREATGMATLYQWLQESHTLERNIRPRVRERADAIVTAGSAEGYAEGSIKELPRIRFQRFI